MRGKEWHSVNPSISFYHSSSCSPGQEGTDVIRRSRSLTMTYSDCHISLQKKKPMCLEIARQSKRRVYMSVHLFQALKIPEAAGRHLRRNRHSDRIKVTGSHLKPRIKSTFGVRFLSISSTRLIQPAWTRF